MMEGNPPFALLPPQIGRLAQAKTTFITFLCDELTPCSMTFKPMRARPRPPASPIGPYEV